MTIQRTWRGFLCRSDYTQKVTAITVIQSSCRAFKARNEYRKNRTAAVIIQACWRRYSVLLNFKLDLLEIVISQSVVRRRLARIEARKRRQSIQVLQSFARRCQAMKRLEHQRRQHHDYMARTASAISLQVSCQCASTNSVSNSIIFSLFLRLLPAAFLHNDLLSEAETQRH